jgi:hypothetical protein
MTNHKCIESRSCTCSVIGIEPADDCPVHSSGGWPPRCEICGRFMKRQYDGSNDEAKWTDGLNMGNDDQDIIDQLVSCILFVISDDDNYKDIKVSLKDILEIILIADLSCLIKYGRPITKTNNFLSYYIIKDKVKYILDSSKVKYSFDRIDVLNRYYANSNSSWVWLAEVDREEIKFAVGRYYMDGWDRFPTEIWIK